MAAYTLSVWSATTKDLMTRDAQRKLRKIELIERYLKREKQLEKLERQQKATVRYFLKKYKQALNYNKI
jgi:hypothetical protein